MNKFRCINVVQGEPEWHQLRATVPTASEISKVITGTGGVSESRLAYLKQKAIARKYPQPMFLGNEHTERGHELEPVAREKFIEATGLDVREVGCVQPIVNGKRINALFSPDGLITSEGIPVIPLEIKCFSETMHSNIVAQNKIPSKMKPQVAFQTWGMGAECAVCCFYHPDAIVPLHFIEVPADNYTKKVGDAVMKFVEELDRDYAKHLAEYEEMMNAPIEQRLPITSRLAMKGGSYE